MDFKQFYKTINFDIDNEIRTVFQATQGDTKSRGLLVDLIVGGVKTPVTTENMTFFALKPDGTRVMTVGVKEGTGFRIDFTNQTFAVPGVLLCTLVLSGTNGEKIADKKFKMTVDSSLEDGAIISEDERGILDRAFDLATDIVPRLEGLDVPLLENLEREVITARGTKPTLGARLDSADADSAKYHFPIQNIITNSNFTNGITGWTLNGAVVSSVNINELVLTTSAQNNRIQKLLDYGDNDIIYRSALVKSTSNQVGLGESSNILKNHSGSGEYERLSVIGKTSLFKYISVVDGRVSGFNGFSVRNIMAINLTKTFGVGNEPSLEDLEVFLSNQPYSSFDGTISGNDFRTVKLDNEFNTFKSKLLTPNKNLIQDTWELGQIIGTTGDEVPSTSFGRTKEYTKVTPNTMYTFSSTGITNNALYVYYYDLNKNFLGYAPFYGVQIMTFTTGASVEYVRFGVWNSTVTGVGILPTTSQLELGGLATSYLPFGNVIKDEYVDKRGIEEYVNNEVTSKAISVTQWQNDSIKAIAHRGYSSVAPENTIPAFKLARENGFKYVECDVQFSSDGVPVLIHDQNVDRTSEGTGFVKDLTLAQLKSYDFGNWKNPIYEGTEIPTFEEFMLACKKLNLHPYIELKSHLDTDQANLLVSIVRNLGMLRQVSWIGFFIDLDLIRDYDSKARIGGLSGAAPSTLAGWVSRITEPGNVFLDMDYNYVTQEVSQMCMDEGIPLEVFTVNDPESVLTLAQYNVSAITTNGLNIPKILADSV